MMAAQNLRDVLSNELNIRLSQDNVLGSSMSMLGISGQNVKILIDGVPVIGRLNGNIDVSQINMNNVERIEIVEGPLSVNYGTDALAGTINIITKKSQKKAFNIANSNYYESNGNYNISGKLGLDKGKNTAQATLGRNYFDGWNPGDQPFLYRDEINADSNRFQSWKPKEQVFAGALLARQIKGLKLSLSSDLFKETIINKGYPTFSQTGRDDYYKTFRLSNTLNLGGSLNENYRTNIIIGYNYFKRIKNTFIKDLTTLESQLTKDISDQDTSQFKTLMSRGNITSTKVNAALNYELGYDINYESGTGIRVKDYEQSIGDYALFGTAEYKPWEQLVIRPGLRLTHNTRYKAPLIPSLNIKYQLPISDNADRQTLTIRASYARGFRAPSLKDLYFNFVDMNHNITGNESLKAEYSHNFIVNASWQRIYNQTILKLEVNNFYNSIENLIILAQVSPSSTTYTYKNRGSFQTFGNALNGELAVKHLKFSFSGGYIAYFNELSTGSNNINRFSYTPEIRSSILYEFKQYGLSMAMFYKYTGKTPGFILNESDEIVQTSIQDYHMADASVSKAFFKGNYNLSVGCKNLFNVTNITGSSMNSAHSGGGGATSMMPLSMGRTLFLKFDINLNYN